MSDISVDRIMRNIYGSSATGQITNLSGGNIDIPKFKSEKYRVSERPLPRVQYIDINNSPVNNMFGGGRKPSKKQRRNNRLRAESSKEKIIIYASPEYIPDNSDLHTFIDKFFLYYRISRSPNSAIYIIPPTSELKEMVKKRGNYPEGSIEMQNAVRKNDNIGYERCLFITFGNNTKSDTYRIDPELTSQNAYPNSSFGMIRRTNIKGEVFYITCDDKKNVKIHTTPKNVKDGNELKFVGRFNNGGYVFQGKLPPSSVEKIGPKKQTYNKVCRKVNKMKFGEMMYYNDSMTGGSNNTTLDLLEKYDEMYKGDHDIAAEHFLRCAAKAGKLSDKYRNNGDLLFSSIYFALSEPTALNECDFCKEDTGNNLFSSFKPVVRGSNFKNKVNDAIHSLNKIYKRSERNGTYNDFVESYKRLYSSNDVCKTTADIMTGYIRNNDSNIESKMINDLYNTFNNSSKASYNTASLIKHAFNSNPLPSAFGMEYYPIITNMKSFESDIKENKYNIEADENDKNAAEDKNLVNEIFTAQPKDPELKNIEKTDEMMSASSVFNDEDLEMDIEISAADMSDASNAASEFY